MPHVQLAILMRSGNTKLFDWGRREKEEGHPPDTGWARMDSIQDGKWVQYHPRPASIIVDQYMEKDRNRESHWFKLDPGFYNRRATTQEGEERRVYVITGPSRLPY